MARFELYKDRSEEYRWRFIASGDIVADSAEGYVNKSGAVNGMNLVKRYAPDADIEDNT